MKKKRLATTAYSISHLLVDMCCAALVLPAARAAGDAGLALLIYNFCAFAMQLPIGALADSCGSGRPFAIAGCVLVGVAGIIPMPLLIVIIAGLGNAAFHIGGGADVLSMGEGKASLLGIFVSPGALGLFIGYRLQTAPIVYAAIMALCILLTLLAVRLPKREAALEMPDIKGKQLAALFALLLVVCIRSYGGMIMNFTWKRGWLSAALIVGVVLGKMAGGILADRFGAARVSTASLGLSAALFLLSDMPAFGIMAVFLFNMTMPVTLWAAAELFNGAKATAFGLLTLCLFLGLLPATGGAAGGGSIYALSALVSLILLRFALRERRIL